MDDTLRMLIETTDRLFSGACSKEVVAEAEHGVWPQQLWMEVEAAGLPLTLVSPDAGGIGLGWVEAVAVVRQAARFAAPIPLAETMLANWMSEQAGLPVTSGAASCAPMQAGEPLKLSKTSEGWSLHGNALRVPWAKQVSRIVFVASSDEGEKIGLLDDLSDVQIVEEKNLASEPRISLVFSGKAIAADKVKPAGEFRAHHLLQRGALLRAGQMAGAMAKAFELAVQYAMERVQFGRPIGKFQAVQQQLAIAAGQVAVAGAATDFAAQTVDERSEQEAALAIAIAKCRAGEAAGQAAAIGHQTHGAIGFTVEHTLHQFTRRLWSWRDECGSESYWSAKVGERMLEAGPEGLWPMISAA